MSTPPEKQIKLLEDFVRQQGQQIELRKRELEIQEKDRGRYWDHAAKVLDAQKSDLIDQRKHRRSQSKVRLFSGILLTILFFVFVGWALYLNKDQIVMDLLKIFLGFLAGAPSGYLWGKSRKPTPAVDDDQE